MKISAQNKKTLWGTISLLWLTTAFIGYLYAHKPFSPEELLGILVAVWRTLIALTILSVAGGIGMLSPIRAWDIPPLTKALLTSALGLGIIGILILVIFATIGVKLPLWILLLVAFMVVRKKIILLWKEWKSETSILQGINPLAIMFLIPILIILISQYLEALAPPFQFDALTYHLVLPKTYLQFGKLTYIPNNIFWGMPQLAEMLYLLAMSLGGLEAAVVLGFWVGILAIIGLADFIKDIGGGNAGWVTAAILFAGAGFTSSLASGYIEWMSILFGAATIIALIKWLEKNDLQSLSIAGIFVGMALSVKYTNGVLLLTSILAVFMFSYSASFTLIFRNLIWFTGAAILIFTPWLIKNFIATNNPFYPIIFPSGAMDATLLNFYQFKPAMQDWSRLVLLPWQATIFGVDGGDGYSSSIGALLLGLSPLAWINWQEQNPMQKNITKLSGVILFSGFLIWAIGSQFRGLLIQTRLYFVLFPAWVILASLGFINLSLLKTQSIRFGNLAKTLILLAIVFNALSTINISAASNPVLTILNQEDDFSYIKRHLGGYIDAMQEINALPSSSKVIMLWEPRSLFCIPKCDPDEIIGRWYNDWTNNRNSEQIISDWKKQGFTHVLISRNGADFVKKYDENAPPKEYWDGLEITLSTLVDLHIQAAGYQLYKIP
ncbi:MAG: glycosyltransferase family 39 protein [Anaerolineales bacterium]